MKKSTMMLAGMSILENRRENLKLIVVLVLESKALYWELPPNWVNHENNGSKHCKKAKIHGQYKRRRVRKSLKRVARDCNCGFWKLIGLIVFQSYFVTFFICNVISCFGDTLVWHKAAILSFTSNYTPNKGIQDSLGLWIPRRGFRIPATEFRFL